MVQRINWVGELLALGDYTKNYKYFEYIDFKLKWKDSQNMVDTSKSISCVTRIHAKPKGHRRSCDLSGVFRTTTQQKT